MFRAFQLAALALGVLVIAGNASAQMQIMSSAFQNGGSIPAKYGCDSQNPPNPPLMFSGIPKNAKSLVLIVEDPDVPKTMMPTGVFLHWIVTDISPDTKGFTEGQGPKGMNGMGKAGYVGPCPPDREHRYFFTLYALDTKVGDAKIASRKDFEDAQKAHILGKAEYMGKYPKSANAKY
jgi:Raf kinase inhibitor-like YbhB/YbcL family protein